MQICAAYAGRDRIAFLKTRCSYAFARGFGPEANARPTIYRIETDIALARITDATQMGS